MDVRGTSILALVLLWAPLVAVQAQAPAQPPKVVTSEELRWQADRLFDEGRYDEARDAYLKIQEAFKSDPEFNRALGWSFSRSRQPDLQKAIDYWTRSWQADGKEDLKVEAAQAYASLGQWQRGSKLLLELARQHPQHPEHWYQVAHLAESAQAYEQAETWYRAFLERRPRDVPSRLAVARILGWAKRYPEAIAQFERALAVEPRNTPARLGIAQVLAWKGDLADSIRRYDEVLREQPANLDAQKGKAFALLWSGQPAAARPLFERVARRRPRDLEVRGALKELARLDAAGAPEAPAGAPGEAAGGPTALERSLTQIDAALRQGDGATAETLTRAALDTAPDVVALRRRLAQALLLTGKTEAAIDLLKELTASYPTQPDLQRELAGAWLRARQFDEATEALAAYLAAKPGDRGARVDRARILSWSRRFDEATREYQRVLQEDPDNIESQVGLAQIDAWQGRSAPALQQYDAVLAQRPAQREALIGKAQALYWTGRHTEALELFGRLEEQFPGDREVATLAADLRETERKRTAPPPDVDTLIREAQAALERSPGDPQALRTLGDLLMRKGDHAQALLKYRQAHQGLPGDPQIQLALARALATTKQYKEAVEQYRALVDSNPDPALRKELAQVLAGMREHAQAVALYDQILDVNPLDHEARLARARLLSWDRQYAAALEGYRAVIEAQPDNREARVEQARVHAWKGDLDRAIELFTALERDYPGDRDVLLGKGQALQWSGRAREAAKILGPLREAYPDDRDVRVAMAGTQLALGRSDLAKRELQIPGVRRADDADVQQLWNLTMQQLRPVLVFGFNPSEDSDDLRIAPLTSTFYFSAVPRVRSYLRGAFIASEIPSTDRRRGREAVFGSTLQASPSVILRGEIGTNVGDDDAVDVIGLGGVTLLPTSKVRLDVSAGRQFLNYLPVALERDISRVLTQAGVDVRPTEDWLLHGDYFYGRYSDDNRAQGGNAIVSRTLARRTPLTVEAGYLYSYSGFSEDPGNGYYAPSRLQRHAGLLNLSGRGSTWFGYTLAGTLGTEQAEEDPWRLDWTAQVSADFTIRNSLKLSGGYGYARIASLSRAGAYLTHSAFARMEIRF